MTNSSITIKWDNLANIIKYLIINYYKKAKYQKYKKIKVFKIKTIANIIYKYYC